MGFNRRSLGCVLFGTGVSLVVSPVLKTAIRAQEQAPNRREVTITARNYEFSPNRIEVLQDDLVKVTLRSEDEAHSFVIDGYRIMKRIPAAGSTTFEFRADKPGTFAFYCGMTNAEGHRRMKGELVVASR
ncbi:MAG: cupredoxin domain-containing protein [Vicinamibacterales bacterium]